MADLNWGGAFTNLANSLTQYQAYKMQKDQLDMEKEYHKARMKESDLNLEIATMNLNNFMDPVGYETKRAEAGVAAGEIAQAGDLATLNMAARNMTGQPTIAPFNTAGVPQMIAGALPPGAERTFDLSTGDLRIEGPPTELDRALADYRFAGVPLRGAQTDKAKTEAELTEKKVEYYDSFAQAQIANLVADAKTKNVKLDYLPNLLTAELADAVSVITARDWSVERGQELLPFEIDRLKSAANLNYAEIEGVIADLERVRALTPIQAEKMKAEVLRIKAETADINEGGSARAKGRAKTQEGQRQNALLNEANSLIQELPPQLRAKLKVGAIEKIGDLQDALAVIQKGVETERLGVDWLKKDIFDPSLLYRLTEISELWHGDQDLLEFTGGTPATEQEDGSPKKKGGFGPDGSFPTEEKYLDYVANYK